MPVDQPGGAGTTLYVYDDSDPWLDVLQTTARTPGPYSFTDVYNGLVLVGGGGGVDGMRVSDTIPGIPLPIYIFSVSVQIGDAGVGTATTTLTDTNTDVYFSTGVGLTYRSSQTTSWFTNLGTKVGSGNQAGAKNGCTITMPQGQFLGTFKLYGCKIIHTGVGNTITMQPSADNNGSELIECTLLATSTGIFTTGTSLTNRLTNLYSHTAEYNVTALTTQAVPFSVDMGLLKISASPPAYVSAANANLIFKDLLLRGTPTVSDYRWTSTLSKNWVLVRPGWTQTAPKKFVKSGAGAIAVADGAKEYWLWNVKVVNALGVAVSGIPVKLTDTTSAVQVNTTTDANGRVAFGSGLTANGIIVMDHYTTGSNVYTQRHRSPFLVEVNTGASANPDYRSQRYYKYWSGYEGVTTSAGTFEDENDTIPLVFASGAATTWIEAAQP